MNNDTDDTELRKMANLRTLQRVSRSCAMHTTSVSLDSSSSSTPPPLVAGTVTDILATATHVVLYEFHTTATSSSGWTKCNMEGSLFLVQGRPDPKNSTQRQDDYYHQLIILNRTSTLNFVYTIPHTNQNSNSTTVEDLLQIHNEEPFIIIKLTNPPTTVNAQPQPPQQQRILGFWFHNKEERISFFQTFQSTLRTIAARPSPPTPSSPPTTTTTADGAADDTPTATALAAMSLKSVLGIGTAETTSTTTDNNNNRTNTTTTVGHDATTGATALPQQPQPLLPLDKKSLQLTLLSLIQDDRFIDLLHSQYCKVVRTRSAAAAAATATMAVSPSSPPQSHRAAPDTTTTPPPP